MNGNEPAFPRPAREYTESGTLAEGNDAIKAQAGMTKREYAAIQIASGLAQAMLTQTGLIAIKAFMDQGKVKDGVDCLTNMAINLADQLLAKLAKGESK